MRILSAVSVAVALVAAGCASSGSCDKGSSASGNAPYLPFFELAPEQQAALIANALDFALPPRRAQDGIGPVFQNDNITIVIDQNTRGPSVTVSMKAGEGTNGTAWASTLGRAIGLPSTTQYASAGPSVSISGRLASGERVQFGWLMAGMAKIGPVSDLTNATITVSTAQAHEIAAAYVDCAAGHANVSDDAMLTIQSASLAWTFMVESGSHGAGVVVIDASTGAVLDWTGLISV